MLTEKADRRFSHFTAGLNLLPPDSEAVQGAPRFFHGSGRCSAVTAGALNRRSALHERAPPGANHRVGPVFGANKRGR